LISQGKFSKEIFFSSGNGSMKRAPACFAEEHRNEESILGAGFSKSRAPSQAGTKGVSPED
jgi:hypothetical protein